MADPGQLRFKCGGCGQRYTWKPELAGKKVRCKCGQAIRVPQASGSVAARARAASPAKKPPPPPLPDSAEPDSMLIDIAPPAAAMKKCLSCSTDMPEAAVLCVKCGFNTQTGTKIGVAQVGGATEQPAGGNAKTRQIIAVVACAVAAIAAGVIWAVVAKATGREIGFVAVGIGALAGLPVLLFADKGSETLGFTAGGCAVVGLIVGKLLLAQWVLPGWVAEWYAPDSEYPEANIELVAWDLARQAGDKEVADWIPHITAKVVKAGRSLLRLALSINDEGWTPPAGVLERLEQFNEQAAKQIEEDGVDATRMAAIAGEFTTDVMSRVSTPQRLKAMSSPWDFLWLSLAVSAAYKLGSGFEIERKD